MNLIVSEIKVEVLRVGFNWLKIDKSDSRRKIEEFSFRKESEKRSKWFTPIFSSKGLTKIRGMLKIFFIFQIS